MTKDSPGFRRLKAAPNYEQIVQRTLEEQRRAVAEVREPRKVKPHRKWRRDPANEDDYPGADRD